jgi:hypothetical protein
MNKNLTKGKNLDPHGYAVKNKKILTYAILPVLGLALLGTGVVSAHGWLGKFSNLPPEEVAEHQSAMFEHKADLLGISVDEMKDYWAEGKNLKEIAEQEGINLEDLRVSMRETRMQHMQERLQSLVDNGVISQEQADQKLQFMQEKFENGEFTGDCKGFKHRGW